MKRCIHILFIACMLPGCYSMRTVQLGLNSDYSDINAKTVHKDAVLTFFDGSKARVSGLSVSPDQTSGIVKRKGFNSWPTDSIVRIQIGTVKEAASAGSLVGGVIGMAAGVIAGLREGDSEPGFYAMSSYESAMLAGVVLGSGGALFGALVGVLTVSRIEYVLLHSPDRQPQRTSASNLPNQERSAQ